MGAVPLPFSLRVPLLLPVPLALTPREEVERDREDAGRVEPSDELGRERLPARPPGVLGAVGPRTTSFVSNQKKKSKKSQSVTRNNKILSQQHEEDSHMNEDGGGAAPSFFARNSADLFVLGATVGACTLATAMVSRLLCPGTPSKIIDAGLDVLLSPAPAPAPNPDPNPNPTLAPGPGPAADPSLLELLILGAGLSTFNPNLNDAALDILGAIAGAAVDATCMTVERLWPGTSMNACFCSSFVRCLRMRSGVPLIGVDVPLEVPPLPPLTPPFPFTFAVPVPDLDGDWGKAIPARREAARVVRGEMSGTRVVLGTGRALKGTGPPVFLLREEKGERVMFVVVELAGLVRCAELESWEEDGERTVVSRLCQSSSPSSSSSLEAERMLLLLLVW